MSLSSWGRRLGGLVLRQAAVARVALRVHRRPGVCAASGPVRKSERRLRRAPLCCGVSVLVAWTAESSTRVECGLGADVCEFFFVVCKPEWRLRVVWWGGNSGRVGDREVGSLGTQPRGWCVSMYRFSAGFPYKLANSLLLNAKAELLLFP